MRTIKFRAWTGKMEYDIMIGKFGLFYVNPGEKGDGLDPKDTASLTPFTTKIDEKYNPIMQFTGLLDKNGKEIYEGDIIFERGQNREVIFHKGCFCVRHFEVEDYPLDRDTYHIFSHEHIEIIGNIYENPELIKD